MRLHEMPVRDSLWHFRRADNLAKCARVYRDVTPGSAVNDGVWLLAWAGIHVTVLWEEFDGRGFPDGWNFRGCADILVRWPGAEWLNTMPGPLYRFLTGRGGFPIPKPREALESWILGEVGIKKGRRRMRVVAGDNPFNISLK
jgi:hypothetical protein